MSQEPEYDILIITPELLAGMSIPSLVELLLHRTSLFSSATTGHVVDIEYIKSIQSEISAIHAEIKRRT